MVQTRDSAPFDLVRSTVGHRASGALFLVLSAAAFFLAWSGVIDLPAEMATFPLTAIGSLFGAILAYMGLSALTESRGFRIDPAAKTIGRFRRGIFGRRYEAAIPFAALDGVSLTLRSWGSGGRQRVFYEVALRLTSGQNETILSTDRFSEARQTAERYARELALDLHDGAEGGEVVVRKPDDLDRTVRDTLREGLSSRLPPPAPIRPHATIRHGSDGLTIDIPRVAVGQLGPMQKALWLLMAALGAGIVAAYYWSIGGLALFCVPVFLVLGYALLRSETIVVSADALSVSTGIGPARIRRSIPLGELEELRLSNLTADEQQELDRLAASDARVHQNRGALAAIVALGSAIVATSDKQKLTMGRILSAAELDLVLYEMERRIRG
ncbi:MAG: hypothetical protein AB7O93_24090 [Vicinamibacterales bacterium]